MINNSAESWEAYNNLMNALREGIATRGKQLLPSPHSILEFKLAGHSSFTTEDTREMEDTRFLVVGITHNEEGIEILIEDDWESKTEIPLQSDIFSTLDLVFIMDRLEKQ